MICHHNLTNHKSSFSGIFLRGLTKIKQTDNNSKKKMITWNKQTWRTFQLFEDSYSGPNKPFLFGTKYYISLNYDKLGTFPEY